MLLFKSLDEIGYDLNRFGDVLEKVEFFSITMGSLGSIWWIATGTHAQNGRFSKAMWTSVNTEEAGLGEHEKFTGQRFPFKEIRNGYGCGDVGRGAFAVSLARNNAASNTHDFMQAVAAMTWIGAARVMFWSLHDFFAWLTRHQQESLNWLYNQEKKGTSDLIINNIPLWPDGQKWSITHEPVTDTVLRRFEDYKSVWDIEIVQWWTEMRNPNLQRSPRWIDAILAWRNARWMTLK